ncbi:hypothetical protein ABW20_dc0110386 [Dactylellina cionopaga]|nr:hypothetical protein ABW20_dc0110386 [Dactylellina cionopaga]
MAPIRVLALALICLVSHVTAQVPTAVVSIVSDSDYVTARPCIQTCIWYNGGLGRGGNSGFNDVGKGIGCGQNPINACYCSERLTSSATSYFSGCIRSLCTAVTDPADLSSALSIYGRYCGTANDLANAQTTTAAGSSSTVATSGSGSGGNGNGVANTSGSGGGATVSEPTSTNPTSSTQQTSSSASAPGASSSSTSGLTTTSKIALGVGLGVGIPVLGVLVAILVILLRKGRDVGGSPVGGIETARKD